MRWCFYLACGLLCVVFSGHVVAHEVPGSNLQLIAELTEEKLSYDVSAETSLIPPLAKVAYGSEPFPTAEDVREELEAYFSEHCPVVIDGVEVRPVLDDVEYAAMENQVNLGEVTNFVMAYALLSYPIKTRPQTVDMRWGIYLPDKVKDIVPETPDPTGHDPQTVGSIFYTFGELDLMKFTPSEPQYVWHSPEPILSVNAQKRLQAAETAVAETSVRKLSLAWPLAGLFALGSILMVFKKRPAFAMVLGGMAAAAVAAYQPLTLSFGNERQGLTGEEALQRFRDLHQNIYRAFDYQDDDAIYDTLAQSVSGDLLDEIYSDVYKSLVLRDEGGAVCRVRKLDYITCEPTALTPDEKGYAFDCHWRVDGLVQHHGHTHERLNDYEARYLLADSGGAWRITNVEIAREKRLNPETLEPEN